MAVTNEIMKRFSMLPMKVHPQLTTFIENPTKIIEISNAATVFSETTLVRFGAGMQRGYVLSRVVRPLAVLKPLFSGHSSCSHSIKGHIFTEWVFLSIITMMIMTRSLSIFPLIKSHSRCVKRLTRRRRYRIDWPKEAVRARERAMARRQGAGGQRDGKK